MTDRFFEELKNECLNDIQVKEPERVKGHSL